jgi:nitroimidazol reductase NimA-like FMN-containing flavoprotein (pyridoxamine 5'-phosphate oxidase superfamily)
MSQAPQMRRVDRVMTEERARQMLASGFCGRVGTTGTHGWPYVVPLLYVWMDEQVYVHQARARGHLRESLDANPRVCFEIDEPSDVFAYGRYECDTGLAYASVIAFGAVRIVEAEEEKTRFFVELMRKYGDPSLQRPPAFFPRLADVTVYAIAIDRLSGKEQALPEVSQRWPALDRTKSPGAIPPERVP